MRFALIVTGGIAWATLAGAFVPEPWCYLASVGIGVLAGYLLWD